MRRYRHYALFLALFALGATPAKPAVGFIDLPSLVTTHPLHAVLVEYDREIAALRSTQEVSGLRDPARTAQEAAAAQQRETSTARGAVAAINRRSAVNDREREREALTTLTASQRAGQASMNDYTGALVRETNASLGAFERATAQRSARAYAARAQQLRESQATLAFDLEREDAGRRLALQLKLDDLHLLPPQRARLRAQLAALDTRESQTMATRRRSDAATLAAYRAQLTGEGSAANAQMAAQLRAKAAANFAQRRVSQSESNVSQRADLGNRLTSFSATYDRGDDAAAIDAEMRDVSGDLSQRFSTLAAADAQSQREVAAQLATLQDDRTALYRSIVAQILKTAARVAQRRGLRGIDFAGKRPNNAVDLTAAVKGAL